MKQFLILISSLLIFNGNNSRKEIMKIFPQEAEKAAFDGISIDFQFKSYKPTFGDLFLIVGYKNPNFPSDTNLFGKLSNLDFEQVDDYFGIKNNTTSGDDVKIWLYPIVGGEEVYLTKALLMPLE